MATDAQLRKRLHDIGKRRTTAIREARASSGTLEPLVVEAEQRGMTVTDIAELSGLSRQAVYNILRSRT
jgi:predicted transcriptional regulator